MASKMSRWLPLFALMVAACSNGQETATQDEGRATEAQAVPAIPADDRSGTDQPQTPARPQEKQDFLRIEGTQETIRAYLVQPDASLPFYTYVPEGLEFEQVSSDEGEGFFFFAAFDGRRNPEAFVLVFVLPEGASEAQAREKADAFIASHRGPRLLSGARLGSHGGRHFYVAYRYPGDFGDGMGSRTAYIREQWCGSTEMCRSTRRCIRNSALRRAHAASSTCASRSRQRS